MATEAPQNSPQVDTQRPSWPPVSEATGTQEAAAIPPPTAAVHLEGPAEAMQQARCALGFIGPAGRFHVANPRMVLLRNALIVLALFAAVVLLSLRLQPVQASNHTGCVSLSAFACSTRCRSTSVRLATPLARVEIDDQPSMVRLRIQWSALG